MSHGLFFEALTTWYPILRSLSMLQKSTATWWDVHLDICFWHTYICLLQSCHVVLQLIPHISDRPSPSLIIIDHLKPSSTITKHHQPWSTSCTRGWAIGSTIINHDVASSTWSSLPEKIMSHTLRAPAMAQRGQQARLEFSPWCATQPFTKPPTKKAKQQTTLDSWQFMVMFCPNSRFLSVISPSCRT